MRAITFYSYKGGVGRTLALANVAHYLALLQQRVVVVDLDLEAPGAHWKLQPATPIEGGVVDLVRAFIDNREMPDVTRWLYDVTMPSSQDGPSRGWVRLLPTGAIGPEYWRTLAGIDWKQFFVGDTNDSSSMGIPFFMELKLRLAQETGADFLLLDARTGVTDLGGLATSLLADDLVCLFILNDESLEGTRQILNAVQNATRLPDSAAIRIFPVLARLPVLDDEEQERIVDTVSERLGITPSPTVEALSIVHSAPSLQVREQILVGDDGPQDEDILYARDRDQLFVDYIRLFNRLLPSGVVDAHLETLVGKTQQRAFKDPKGARTSLNEIARRYPHQHSYRALLEFNRLREERDEEQIGIARDLVRLTNDPKEELVWDIVRSNIEVLDLDLHAEYLSFIERVWRTHGATDLSVGLFLSRGYRQLDEEDKAARVIEILAGLVSDPEMVASVAGEYGALGKADVGLELIGRFPVIQRTIPIQRAAARLVVAAGQRKLAADYLERGELNEQALRGEPELLTRLLTLAGKSDQALARADHELNLIIQGIRTNEFTPRTLSRVKDAYALFAELGRADEFQKRVREHLTLRSQAHVRIRKLIDELAE